MKLSILVDNHTFVDRYFIGEPALSIFIEADGFRILFDLGYSDAFLKNAGKMGIDLLKLDYIVLSHNHQDHTWGLPFLMARHAEEFFEQRPARRPVLVSSPMIFESRRLDSLGEIGSIVGKDKAARFFDLNLSESPVRLTDNLYYLGKISRTFDFEGNRPFGTVCKDGQETACYVEDDSALACRTRDGLVVITGCSHSGICNIVEQARRVCGDDRVIDIVGGLHLINPSERQMAGTTDYLASLGLKDLHAGHCTDLASKIKLAAKLPLREVGVGLALNYD